MRKILFALTLIHNCMAYAQPYDLNWVMGYTNLIIKFSDAGLTIDSASLAYRENFLLSSSCSISDSSGILFYSDGAKVYQRDGHTMQNGNKLFLSNTDMQITYSDTFYGHNYPSNPLCLPLAAYPDSFVLIHKSLNDTFPSLDFYLSVIDIKENNGWGSVVSPSNVFARRMSGINLAACKHANGRDWWVIGRHTNSNQYVKWLFRADGSILVSDTQAIGPVYVNPDYLAQSVFNHQGSMYVTGGKHHISLFGFDRCSGLLTYRDSIVATYDSLFNGVTGMQFSKSGEMLYITRYNTLTQYNTSVNPIDISGLLLCDLRVHNIYRKFKHMQLMPDSRILISGYGSPIPYSIIHYPDSGGFACGLDTFVLPFNNSLNTLGMPTYPHYRTPAAEVWQAGSGSSRTVCDTTIAQGVQLGKPHIPGIAYQWSSPTNPVFSSTEPQPVVYPTQNTTYVLRLRDTVNTYYSCTERWDTVTVTIQKCIDTTAPLKPIQGISIFPNPFKSELTLQTETDGIFELYNTLGQLVLKANLQGQQTHTISTAHMAAGVYHYRVTQPNGETKQGKVVKE